MTTQRYFTIMAATAGAAALVSCELFQLDPATGARPITAIGMEAGEKIVASPNLIGVTEAIGSAAVAALVGWLAIRRRNAKRAAAK